MGLRAAVYGTRRSEVRILSGALDHYARSRHVYANQAEAVDALNEQTLPDLTLRRPKSAQRDGREAIAEGHRVGPCVEHRAGYEALAELVA